MRKLLILIGMSVLLFFSCKTLVAFDESIPEEKTARISFDSVGNITAYNGIPVNWKRSLAFNVYQIPAGETTLEFDLDNRNYFGKNILVKYDFQPQKEYFFDVGKRDNMTGLIVYAWDYGEKGAGSGTPKQIQSHYVGFAPFLNTRQGNQKMVLD
jgi:hypothetical protein